MAIMTTSQRSVENAAEFKKVFSTLHLSAVAVTLVRSREPFRAIETLRQFAFADNLKFQVWTILRGWETYNRQKPEDEPISDNMLEPVAALKKIGTPETEDGVYVMFYPHTFLKNSLPFIVQVKEYSKRFTTGKKRLVLVTPPGFSLPVELEDDVSILDFDTPSYKELSSSLRAVLETPERSKRPSLSDDDFDRLLAAASGLTEHEAEAAVARGLVENRLKLPNVTADDLASVVMRVKVEAVRKTDILEVMPAESMSNVGGLENLKEWVRKRANCFSDEARAYGIEPPKGVLLVGPPGTGKSLTAKAIAREMGLPLIKFDVSRVFAGIVGESESRVRNALKMIEGMAPCVVLIDEVDKALGGVANGGGGDSGVSKRVLGAILTWMQETQAPVFNVLSANRVDALPAELMRRGRLDEVFSVNVPNEQERREILSIHLRKRGKDPAGIEDLETAVDRCEGYVPAEIECAVKDALIDAFTAKQPITGALISNMFANMVPISQAFAEDFQRMQQWAEQNARPANRPVGATGPTPIRQRVRPTPAAGMLSRGTRAVGGIDG